MSLINMCVLCVCRNAKYGISTIHNTSDSTLVIDLF